MATITIHLRLTDTPSPQVLTCADGASFATISVGGVILQLPLFVPESSVYARAVAAAFLEAAYELDRRDALQPATDTTTTIRDEVQL